MADIKVTSADLHGVSSQLSSGSADIESRLWQLQGQVQGLVDDGWQGRRRVRFMSCFSSGTPGVGGHGRLPGDGHVAARWRT